MGYALLADLVLAVHALFIVFAVFGGLLALRWWAALWLHLPALAWALAIEVTAGTCPLTPLEQQLRRAAGQRGYEGGFVEHLLEQLVYPPGLDAEMLFGLAVLLFVWNGAVYAFVLLRRARRSA